MAPKANDRSRSPKGNESDNVASASAGVAFESMWEGQFEAKLDAFKHEVKGAVKNLVVDEMGKFEARIDEKLEKQATEVQGVKEAVDRIESALAARSIAPGPTEHSIPPPIPPSYAQVVGANPFPPLPLSLGTLPVPKIFPPKNLTSLSLGVGLTKQLFSQTQWQMSKSSCPSGKLLLKPWQPIVIWPHPCSRLLGNPWATGLRFASMESLAL